MLGNEATDEGAAIYVYKQSWGRSTVRMTNLALAANRCPSNGADSAVVDLNGGTNNKLEVALAHVTAADNQAATFLHARASSPQGQVTATLTNTLVVSFTNAFVGDATGGGDLLIWHNHTLTQNVSALHTTLGGGTPVFVAVNPLGGDARLDDTYRLRPGSDAIDAGVDAGVTVDIDGDPRPYHDGYDIGADEFVIYHVCLPLVNRIAPQPSTWPSARRIDHIRSPRGLRRLVR
jgi:hypothetical protein